MRPAPPALLATPCQISALGPQNLKSCSWNWPVIRRASPHGKAEFSWGQEPNLLIFLCVFRSIPSCWAPSGCPATQHDARKDVFRASCGDATKAPHGILGAAAALLTADFLLSFLSFCFLLSSLPPSTACTRTGASPSWCWSPREGRGTQENRGCAGAGEGGAADTTSEPPPAAPLNPLHPQELPAHLLGVNL